MTTARWYGGQADVPSRRSFSSRNDISRCGLSSALVSWNRKRLVGRAAALGHEEERVGVAVDRRDLDLGREVGLGVDLVPHRGGGHLRVAEVVALVGVEDAAGEGLLVAAAGEHQLALLALHDRGAGVLAHGEDAAGRDARRSGAGRWPRSGRWPRPRGRRGCARSWARWPGRRKWAMSCIAWAASSVRTSGSTVTKVRPAASTVDTPSMSSLRYEVASGPVGRSGVKAKSVIAPDGTEPLRTRPSRRPGGPAGRHRPSALVPEGVVAVGWGGGDARRLP